MNDDGAHISEFERESDASVALRYHDLYAAKCVECRAAITRAEAAEKEVKELETQIGRLEDKIDSLEMKLDDRDNDIRNMAERT